MIINIKKGLLNYKEILFWTFALLFLYMQNDHHALQITICPLALLNFDFCPGCGIGSSIAASMKGEILNAFSIHPIGPFALLIILHRIGLLIINKINHAKSSEVIA